MNQGITGQNGRMKMTYLIIGHRMGWGSVSERAFIFDKNVIRLGKRRKSPEEILFRKHRANGRKDTGVA